MKKKRTLNELRQTKEYYVLKEKIVYPEKMDAEEYHEALRSVTCAILDEIDLEEMVREEMMDQGYFPDAIDEDQLIELHGDIVEHIAINLKNSTPIFGKYLGLLREDE